MQAFEHASPATREDAVRLLSEVPGAMLLAGGSDLLALMKDDVLHPKRLVSVRAVKGLAGVTRADDGVRIGALTTLDEILEDASLREEFPALHQAAASIHSPQVRNVATLGGNLCQWPRCWYFRNGHGLLARRDGRSLVEDGDNRYHAVLGNDVAAFVSPSSLAPALVALGARVHTWGPKGEREMPVAELYRAPRADGERHHVLGDAELLTEVVIPRAAGRVSAFYEVRQRQSLDWPLASAACSFQWKDGRLTAPRLVLGHVAPTPWPCAEAERVLDGSAADAPTLALAAEAAVAGARPLSGNGYKVQLAKVALRRAVLRATGREAT